tara:strand:+ start:215 stop:601 length:387 start_codon:yes stop_codon:yes gene_type:complete
MKKDTKIGSNKSFGIIFSILFTIINIYIYYKIGKIITFFVGFTALIVIITFLKPSIFRPYNILWSKFGILLGYVMSPLIMFVLFILLFVPMGILLKIIRKDLLKLQIKETKTFWEKTKDKDTDMKYQF